MSAEPLMALLDHASQPTEKRLANLTQRVHQDRLQATVLRPTAIRPPRLRLL
ncbi:MAG: hypothetical protein ABSF71_14700 [Terriglobia bacterium]